MKARATPLCLALCLAISALGMTAARAVPITTFVSILPQKYFVQRIAGDLADVSVMVGPGDSPATYEPMPRQMDALSKARVYFRIGVPFEQVWMTRLAAANPSMLIVDTAAGIERPGKDPHVWTDPMLVKRMAARIRDAFIGLDPAHAADYRLNYSAFAADLDALDAEIRTRLAPYKGRAFLVFHPSWSYFARAYGLRQIPIEAEGKEPGPKALAHVISEARALKIKAVFVQPQFSRASAEMIAHEIGGHVIEVDPLAEDYIRNLRQVAISFADAMGTP
jgi:zinc transport system substrate-binding protein